MQFLGYFERFAFRGFNFWDRATRAEYWCVMPVIWGLIILAFVWDVQEIWQFLLRREVPPLNPLYYESFTLFFITLIPRMALTTRRLHDSNKSGRWCTLPVVAVTSGFWLIVGLGAAAMTAGAGGIEESQADMLGAGLFIAAIFFGSVESTWEVLFSSAAALNALGWDAIWATLSDLMSRVQAPPTQKIMTGFQQGMQKDPVEGISLLLIMISMVATPFVAILLHVLFMLLPSDREFNAYGESSVPPISGAPRQKTRKGKNGKPAHNPLEGYACLFEKTPEEKARLREVQQAELKELYRSRVLGQSQG